MPDTKPETAGSPTDGEDELEDIGTLRLRGDVDGLLELAKAFRAKRDLEQCFEAYKAAADLGNGDASYGVALFYMTGGVVPQDLKEGTTQLRAAAEKGSVPAKVYLGNLYELGIHYKADPEKADVWYRNAARGARIEEEPGTPEHALALAELGCARYAQTVSVPEEERTRLLQRARAHGLGLKLKDDTASIAPGDRPTFLAALSDAEKPAPTADAKAEPGAIEPKPAPAPEKEKPKAKPKDSTAAPALAAFGYAILFALAGLGAAYACALGARELVAHGTLLPGLGARTNLVFPIVFGLVGVLPTTLVYRFGAVLKSVLVGCALAGVGFIAWNTGQATLHSDRFVQAFAFGLAGFLAASLVFGFFGGAKTKPKTPTRRHLSG